jgi:hypothetical protein
MNMNNCVGNNAGEIVGFSLFVVPLCDLSERPASMHFDIGSFLETLNILPD